MKMTLRCKWLIAARVGFISVLLMVAGASTLAYTQQTEPVAVKVARHDVEIQNQTNQITEIKTLLVKQEERIRSMEDSRNKIYGGMSLIAGLLVVMNGFMLVLQVKEHVK